MDSRLQGRSGQLDPCIQSPRLRLYCRRPARSALLLCLRILVVPSDPWVQRYHLIPAVQLSLGFLSGQSGPWVQRYHLIPAVQLSLRFLVSLSVLLLQRFLLIPSGLLIPHQLYQSPQWDRLIQDPSDPLRQQSRPSPLGPSTQRRLQAQSGQCFLLRPNQSVQWYRVIQRFPSVLCCLFQRFQGCHLGP